MKKFLLALSVPFLLMYLITTASAVPVQWTTAQGGNNHWYEVVNSGAITWNDANITANALSYEGLSGSLASITSEQENVFVSSLVNTINWGPAYGPWLGGYRTDTGDADWTTSATWTDGSQWGYTNWDATQPTNTGGDQYYLHYYPANEVTNSFTWNDSANNGYGNTRITGYVVEYAPVPEPNSILLLGAGLLAFAGIRRKK